MQDVIIVCAGSYGKEAYWVLHENNRQAKLKGLEEPYNILGFINDKLDALDGYDINEPILGTIQDWYPKGDEKYVMGLGTPKDKKMLAEKLMARGFQFINAVSDLANVSPDIKMGIGCLITMGSTVGCEVELGDFTNINGSMIYSGAKIGSYSTTTGFTVVENATVKEGVYIGSKAVITNGCTVGAWSQVAVGSVVTEDVRPGVTVFGMPAQEIG